MQTIQEIRTISSKDQAVIDFMKSVMNDPKLAKELALHSKFVELVVQYQEYFI